MADTKPAGQNPQPPRPQGLTPAGAPKGNAIISPSDPDDIGDPQAQAEAEAEADATPVGLVPPQPQPRKVSGPQYRLLADHYFLDQIVPSGTIVGAGTSFPFEGTPSTQMEGANKAGEDEIEEFREKRDRRSNFGVPYSPQQGRAQLPSSGEPNKNSDPKDPK